MLRPGKMSWGEKSTTFPSISRRLFLNRTKYKCAIRKRLTFIGTELCSNWDSTLKWIFSLACSFVKLTIQEVNLILYVYFQAERLQGIVIPIVR